MQPTATQRQALDTYKALLIEWNQRQNLTAIRDPEEMDRKHFQDSLTVLPYIGADVGRVIDVGTGAGFPGLVLKIMRPEIALTLVESVGKKCNFLTHVANELGLDQVTVLNERAEAVGQLPDHREQYDVAIARACAHLPVLSEYLLPLVRVGGTMLAMKGESASREVQEAQQAISLLGGQHKKTHTITVPQISDPRFIIEIEKNSATPSNYPRRVGKPSKRPL